LDFGADRDQEYVAGQDLNRAGGQGASSRMMSGGSGPVEGRESENPDVETGRSAPGGAETGRGGRADTQSEYNTDATGDSARLMMPVG